MAKPDANILQNRPVTSGVYAWVRNPVYAAFLFLCTGDNYVKAAVTCLDYSPEMMATAQKRAKLFGLANIRFLQGDVGALPFPDASFDIVLSLNGFHAFPDKEAAYRETFRVLKPGGVFCGCFYVRDETPRTDRWIHRFYEPKGFFTPPYETAESLRARLSGMYSAMTLDTVKSIAAFSCKKGGADR